VIGNQIVEIIQNSINPYNLDQIVSNLGTFGLFGVQKNFMAVEKIRLIA
jgi:hypothetical protein